MQRHSLQKQETCETKARQEPLRPGRNQLTRMEEIKEAIRLLNEPDLDGDRILLLVQETTIDR